MKRFGFIAAGLVLSFVLVAPTQKIRAQPSSPAMAQLPQITDSTIFAELEAIKQQNPQMTLRQLAERGNQLLKEKGVTYIFNVCGFLKDKGHRLSTKENGYFQPFSVRFTTVNGQTRNFQINAGDGTIGGCFTKIAAFEVTDKEMTVMANGQPVRVRRPKDFHLGQTELRDRTLKKVIRRWEPPFEGHPLGISADGTRLYWKLTVDEEELRRSDEGFDWISELVLELSETGGLKFRDLKELKNLENSLTQKEPGSYLIFRQKGKTFHVIPAFNQDFWTIYALGLFTPPKKAFPIETRSFSQKNPTTYEFARPLHEVREKILTTFKDINLMLSFSDSFSSSKAFVFRIESKDDPLFSKEIFDNPENKNDLFLHSFGEVIGPSPVYFGGGKPLRYRAEFQLHLTAPDANRTKVSVITHKPSVINGSKCCGLHGYMSNDVKVEPTTIEEYKILLFIGSILGVNNMPVLRMPEGTK